MSRTGIQIEGDIYLDIDDLSMSLKRYTGKLDKDDKEISISISHHNDLEGVARKLYKLKLKDTTAKNLQELIAAHKRIIDEIRETFQLKGLVK